MSFQSCLDRLHARTGKRPDEFRRLAARAGLVEGGVLKPGVKAARVAAWAKAEFDLGRGHAKAIYILLGGPLPGDED
jgi:hypothetical protein